MVKDVEAKNLFKITTVVREKESSIHVSAENIPDAIKKLEWFYNRVVEETENYELKYFSSGYTVKSVEMIEPGLLI